MYYNDYVNIKIVGGMQSGKTRGDEKNMRPRGYSLPAKFFLGGLVLGLLSLAKSTESVKNIGLLAGSDNDLKNLRQPAPLIFPEHGPCQKSPYDSLPINMVPYASAHNAFDQASMATLLDRGVRVLELDVHLGKDGRHMVYHGGDPTSPSYWNPRPVLEYFKELKEWLDEHPGEIVIVQLEDRDIARAGVNRATYREDFVDPLLEIFPGGLFDRTSRYELARKMTVSGDGKLVTWPSKDFMVKGGKRLLVFSQYFGNLVPEFHDSRWGGNIRNSFDSSRASAFTGDCDHLKTKLDSGLKEVREGRGFIQEVILPFVDLLRSMIPEPIHNAIGMGNIPKSDGRLTVENIRKLKKCGVNFFSLDKIDKNDPRVREILSPPERSQSCYF